MEIEPGAGIYKHQNPKLNCKPQTQARVAEMRAKMADIYQENPTLTACNTKIEFLNQKIDALGAETATNAKRLQSLRSVRDATQKLVDLLESKRKQWQHWTGKFATITTQLETLINTRPESLEQYPTYLQELESLTKKLQRIIERQALYVGADVKDKAINTQDGSHGKLTEIAPGVPVVTVLEHFFDENTDNETLSLNPSAEERMFANYFASIDGKSEKHVRDFHASQEYKDLRREFLATEVKYGQQTPEAYDWLNMQFAKVVQQPTPNDRKYWVQELQTAWAAIRQGLVWFDSNTSDVARCMIGGFYLIKTNNNPYPISEDLLAKLVELKIGVRNRDGQAMEKARNEILAEFVPILNARKAHYDLEKKGPVLPPHVRGLRVNTENGTIEATSPPNPQMNIIGARRYQQIISEKTDEAARRGPILEQEDRTIEALVNDIDRANTLAQEIKKAHEKALECERLIQVWTRISELADNQLTTLQPRYQKLENLLKSKIHHFGTRASVLAEEEKERDELAKKLDQLTHETPVEYYASSSPYARYSIKSCERTISQQQFELSSILSEAQAQIAELEEINTRLTAMTEHTFIDQIALRSPLHGARPTWVRTKLPTENHRIVGLDQILHNQRREHPIDSEIKALKGMNVDRFREAHQNLVTEHQNPFLHG